MNLTFKGFLRAYCAELTGLRTDNLRKQLDSVLSDCPHAAEALMVFAAVQGKERYLSELAVGTELELSYAEAATAIEEKGLRAFLESDATPERFRKVRNAYIAKKEAIVADRRVISLMRERTLSNLEACSYSIYRLSADMGLNQGNLYAYLNKGDLAKVSRDTARRIMDYTQELLDNAS